MENYIYSKGFYRYKKGLYIKKICEYCNSEFYCRKDRISTKKTCNYICHQKLVEKNKSYSITTHVNDVIVGSLLSDGTINNSNNGKNYFWSHTSINEDYINFIIKDTGLELNKFSTKPSSFISPTNNKEYISSESFTLKSRASITFTKYRKEWYPNDIKIVPKNIKLKPVVILHWFLGDGTLDDNGITLCTDSFDENSIFFLLQELSDLNFEPSHSEKRNRIMIPNRRIIEFFTYIGVCPVVSFEYKWNTFIKESYLNRCCINCGNIFDAIYNHQKYCKPKCAIDFSNKSGNKLKEMKKKFNY